LEDAKTQRSEKCNMDTIVALEGEKMVTLEMLEDAWLDEYKVNLQISLQQCPPAEPMPVTPRILT
jgi:hypothetical protein